MRVMFTTMPATAHLFPYVPLANALVAAGHEVCVASHPDMADTITAAGLIAISLGEKEDITGAVRSSISDRTLERITEALAIPEQDVNFHRAVRNYVLAAFALYYPLEAPGPDRRPFADDLISFSQQWKPDLVLWDPIVYPSPIAARACGAAHARFLWGVDHSGWLRTRYAERLRDPESGVAEDLLADRMAPTLRRLGHEFHEELFTGQWSLDLMPATMRLDTGLRYLRVRRVPYNGAQVMPEWLYEPPSKPRVCLSLGVSSRRFFSRYSKIPFTGLLEVIAGLDVEVVATLNAEQIASVGEVPENVRIVDYISLNLLLPTCSAIVHHGGGGTSAAAVANRVPQIITPTLGSDRLETGRYLTSSGAGLMTPFIEDDAFELEGVKKALLQVLTNPSFQDGADAVYRDMLATPAPYDIVPTLEKLTAEYRTRK